MPATSANLGPGFDVLGLALTLYNEVEIRTDVADDDLFITVTGRDAQAVPLDDSNFVAAGAAAAFRLAGVRTPTFGLSVTQEVPVASGLGSSAAALVGGALAANAILDSPVGDDEIIFALLDTEGHAEQLAAALFGGCVAVAPSPDMHLTGAAGAAAPTIVPLPVSEDLCVVLAIPTDVRLPTKTARSVLPNEVPFADAVWNVAAAVALTAGLAEADPLLIRVGMRDKLHQDARAQFLPSSLDVLGAARSAGALGACWSGAGPTMLALCADDDTADEVAAAMLGAFGHHKIEAEGLVCGIDTDGTVVLELDDEPVEPPEYEDDEESDGTGGDDPSDDVG